jgi:hypothetical protein
MQTITAEQYNTMSPEQKCRVLRLASNRCTLDQIRGGVRDRRSAPMTDLNSITDRELIALGNVAFRCYKGMTLVAP